MSTSAVENTKPTNSTSESPASCEEVNYFDYLDYAVVKDAPLDSHLMTMDEEFNSSFERRMSKIVDTPELKFVQDGDELYKVIKIFQRVAQQMGSEWEPVFLDLVKNHKKEVVEAELKHLETHKPILRGYRALMVWKELAGSLFHMAKLVDALKVNKMEDIAQEVLFMLYDKVQPQLKQVNIKPKQSSIRRKRIDVSELDKEPIDNKVLLLIAKKLASEWKKLGEVLGTDENELKEIENQVGALHEKSFKILWSWKEEAKKSNPESCISDLKTALTKMNRKDVVDECFGDKK
ncbi:hypothetical protein HELRODRAFT_173702 [Helobdella robusta]|uniref:Death domain-containing protein n=1 Tax=Helobdella robusta TaxID=6412 RepID=T1F748_HELRO|nr:hypothetical protein HELRODRAFT_173702 [Helobdella robusta]ESO03405.1 hypothetical protein HELRODRAFT_173702 [Helobdella robusta]